ncbi:MAG: amidase [Caulobacteraceae bacterium]|nr:MAG: amidase [Caulobacteraceae bacterium]
MTKLTRRGLLAASAGATTLAAGGLAGCASGTAVAPNAPSASWTPDATELAGRIRKGEMSAGELMEATIRKAEALQPKLGFIVNSDFDRALDKARRGGQTGPFAGVPFLVKDLDDYVGMPTRSGSRWTLGHPPATKQDVYIDAFERAGLIFFGKSASPEYGFLPTTEPIGYNPTRNPWDTSRSSGGSSGGAAVAVASGVIPIAHASDGGGSIRIPASCCGLFGLKPSRGRMIDPTAQDKVVDISVNHAVARSVRDSAALFAATERPNGSLPAVGLVTEPLRRKLKVGLLYKSGNGKDPGAEVRAAVDGTAKLLESLGHAVEPTDWPVDSAQFGQDFLTLWSSGAAQLVQAVAQATGKTPDTTMLEPFSLGMAQLIATLPAGALEQVIGRLTADAAAYDAWFARYDVVLMPVLTNPPVPLGFVSGDVPFQELAARLTDYVGYTPLHNVAGAPSMSVPLHWTAEGLPIGSQICARRGQERLLFELAYQLEAARPWAGRKPPVSA